MNKTLIPLGVLVVGIGYVVCAYAEPNAVCKRNALNGIDICTTPSEGTPLNTQNAIHLGEDWIDITSECDTLCQQARPEILEAEDWAANHKKHKHNKVTKHST